MEYLREGDENTEISTGCQCQCQSLALDSSKRGTRYKTGRLTAQGDTDDTRITMVMVQNYKDIAAVIGISWKSRMSGAAVQETIIKKKIAQIYAILVSIRVVDQASSL